MGQSYERDGITFTSSDPYGGHVEIDANGHRVLNLHDQKRFDLEKYVESHWAQIEKNMAANAKTAAFVRPKYSAKVEARIKSGNMGVRTNELRSPFSR